MWVTLPIAISFKTRPCVKLYFPIIDKYNATMQSTYYQRIHDWTSWWTNRQVAGDWRRLSTHVTSLWYQLKMTDKLTWPDDHFIAFFFIVLPITVKPPNIRRTLVKLLITQMQLEHRLSPLFQLHFHSRLNAWLQLIRQRQLQDDTRNI